MDSLLRPDFCVFIGYEFGFIRRFDVYGFPPFVCQRTHGSYRYLFKTSAAAVNLTGGVDFDVSITTRDHQKASHVQGVFDCFDNVVCIFPALYHL